MATDEPREGFPDPDAHVHRLKRDSSSARDAASVASPHDQWSPYWQRDDYEKAPLTSDLEQLQRMGIELPEPRAMDEAQMAAKLDEVIRALAAVGSYLYSTDHLSDRELYARLYQDVLREQKVALPAGLNRHIDMVGSGSDEHIQLWLRYYADEEDRRSWAREWPSDPIPARSKPPFDRDRFLPRPPRRSR